MSLRLEIKKKMLERSPRVKAIDFHPLNTWVVFGLYSGTLSLYDYSNNVRTFTYRLPYVRYKHLHSLLEQSSSCPKSIGS